MSFNKARERSQQLPAAVGTAHRRPHPDTLLCKVSGCGRRWAVDIQHGKVCSMHDELFSREHAPQKRRIAAILGGLPTLGQVVKPYCDPEKDDE
jgi:hypothetical protein